MSLYTGIQMMVWTPVRRYSNLIFERFKGHQYRSVNHIVIWMPNNLVIGHLKSKPYDQHSNIHDLNTKLVSYSDPHFKLIFCWIGPLLPFELQHGVAVGGGEEGIFLIGGRSSAGKKNKDSILRLRKGKWETLKISLEIARSLHVAMLVPSSLFKCWFQ